MTSKNTDISKITTIIPAATQLSYVSSPMPLYNSSVSAGFPSPVDDDTSLSMDLNAYLINNPPATFFVRASGTSMVNAGIQDGDLLVVDRSLKVKNQDIIIASIDGDLTLKRLYKTAHQTILKTENPNCVSIEITDDMTVNIWGVVTYVIHQFRS